MRPVGLCLGNEFQQGGRWGGGGGGEGSATGAKRSSPRNYKVGSVFLRKTLSPGAVSC